MAPIASERSSCCCCGGVAGTEVASVPAGTASLQEAKEENKKINQGVKSSEMNWTRTDSGVVVVAATAAPEC